MNHVFFEWLVGSKMDNLIKKTTERKKETYPRIKYKVKPSIKDTLQ